MEKIDVSTNTWKLPEWTSIFYSFLWLMSLFSGLLQETVGKVLDNVEAAQHFLDTNTTLIVETVSRATSHMSKKGGGLPCGLLMPALGQSFSWRGWEEGTHFKTTVLTIPHLKSMNIISVHSSRPEFVFMRAFGVA